jgi:hypothetical protein
MLLLTSHHSAVVGTFLLWSATIPPSSAVPPVFQSTNQYSVFSQQINKDDHSQASPSQPKKKVEALEDLRLDQCAEKGKNWEQCFFYGTDTVSVKDSGKFMKARKNVKAGLPTW